MLPNSKFFPLRFGTSGIRAPVADMTDMECYINTRGFLRYLFFIKEIESGSRIAIAGDLRSSTPRIMKAVHKAISAAGCKTIYCGFLPTPTLTYYAWKKHVPAIMVTGSHIPEELNGIKFIKSSEEVLKKDEKDILSHIAIVREKEYSKNEYDSLFDSDSAFKQSVDLPDALEEKKALLEFQKRYTNIFPPTILTGKKIVLYEQSAVGRSLLKNILISLGAEVICFGKSDKFIPMDTEKMPDSVINLFKKLAQEFQPFAIVSTDGDSDRPVLADENGSFLSGDLLGTLVSLYLKPDFASMPVTCDDAAVAVLEKSHIKVALTKVGSPYVIASMNENLVENPNAKVVSWERNGGYLLGSDLIVNNKVLNLLPTRDAIFPILIAIIFSIEEGVSLSVLIDSKLPHRFTFSDAINNKTKGCESYSINLGKIIINSFSPKDSGAVKLSFSSKNINQEARNIKSHLEKYFNSTLGYSEIESLDYLDGIRISFSGGDIVHLRPSSNAPEFRFYVTADTNERKHKLLADCFVIIPLMISDIV